MKKFLHLNLSDVVLIMLIYGFVLRSINYGYSTGQLSTTQKQGIVTYIPKDNKPKTKYFLKNWRPLTLLDTVYEIAS